MNSVVGRVPTVLPTSGYFFNLGCVITYFYRPKMRGEIAPQFDNRKQACQGTRQILWQLNQMRTQVCHLFSDKTIVRNHLLRLQMKY
jgi:hypothetical protein